MISIIYIIIIIVILKKLIKNNTFLFNKAQISLHV